MIWAVLKEKKKTMGGWGRNTFSIMVLPQFIVVVRKVYFTAIPSMFGGVSGFKDHRLGCKLIWNLPTLKIFCL